MAVRPLRKRIIVAVNMNQKEDYQLDLGNGVKIWMRSNYGFDNKQSKPVLARIVGVHPDEEVLRVGDFILCHHNTFAMEQNGNLYGDLGMKDDSGLSLFSIQSSLVWLTVDQQGIAHPLPDFLLVERMEKKVNTSLVVPDSAKKPDEHLFRVLEVGKNFSRDAKQGDLILCYKHSDVPVTYTWQEKSITVYRVNMNDVVGIYLKDSKAYEEAIS